jgi:hypothetical protein
MAAAQHSLTAGLLTIHVATMGLILARKGRSKAARVGARRETAFLADNPAVSYRQDLCWSQRETFVPRSGRTPALGSPFMAPPLLLCNIVKWAEAVLEI